MTPSKKGVTFNLLHKEWEFPKRGIPTLEETMYRPAQIERWLHWFKTSFALPDNSTTNSYSLTPNKRNGLYVLVVSRTHFRVNPHFIVA